MIYVTVERCGDRTLITESDRDMFPIRTFTTPPNAVFTLLDGTACVVNDLGVMGIVPKQRKNHAGHNVYIINEEPRQ